MASAADAFKRKPRVPNWAIAGALGLASIATYYYTLHAVGTTDIDAEVQKVLDSQKEAEKQDMRK